MTDVAADGAVSETLALRKELGPVRCDGESNMVDQDYGGAWVTSMFQANAIQFQDFTVAKISPETLALRKELCPGSDVDGESKYGGSGLCETLALRKELGPGSDVTGEQHGGSGLGGEAWVLINVPGECAIQFQDYSVAKVISMMRLEFQATGPR
ncbi:hypothetical protein MUG91_G633n1 [Manis pentadactyla]|nr:hypothetical protein MUG91_G633n1 [Manis pentadactyla]